MTRLTTAQRQLIRKRPQNTKLSLSIFQPQVVFRARVNDSEITKGARVIPFDSVSLGTFLSVQQNATMWVGTTPGAKDLGKIRIKDRDAVNIYVSENANIEWQNDAYLTVFYYFELWPVYPRIIQDPANAENVIFYKDYDIPYTNQNEAMGSFINMGPHRAVGLDASGQAQLYYSASGTYNVHAEHTDDLTYLWYFQGANVTGTTGINPGYVTYSQPGHYVTRLIVTDTEDGVVNASYRYVSVYDEANPPIQKWQLLSLGGSRDQGGYKASFRIDEDINIEENAVVVVYADDWYGDTHESFGGNALNSSKIFFVGHILEDSIHYDYQHSYVQFDAGSLTQLMKDSMGFSVSVESVVLPDVWYELQDMDCERAIFHYLRWHTTAMLIGDFEFVGEDRKIQYFDADRTSMYDAIDNLMRGTLIGKVTSDRQGKTWMEVDAKATPSPTTSFPSIMDISKRDWMNEPSIQERLSDDLSYLEYGGIAYSGVVTGTFSAILASAPGNTPSFRGNLETHEGLALLGQAQLNELVGNVWANENAFYPKIDMELGINASNFDIAPQETANISISASDTVRGIAIQGLYLADGMNWKYDSKNAILLPNISWKSLVDGVDGQTIVIADSNEQGGGGFNVPGLQIPPIPLFTFPAYAIPTGTISQIVETQISDFESSYGHVLVINGGVASTGSRGMTVGSVTIAAGVSGASFALQQAGTYFVSAYWEQACTGMDTTTPNNSIIQGDMQIIAGNSLRIRARAYADSAGAAEMNGAVVGVVQGVGSIDFVLTSSILAGGGTLASPFNLGFSAVRISA